MTYFEIMVTVLTGSFTTALGAFLGYLSSERSANRSEFRSACNKLRDSFLPEYIKFKRATVEIEGTTIYDVIIKVYGKHCSAVERFASNLKGKQLIAFYSAWHEYQYPDNKTDSGPFGYYITPDENGKDRLISPEFISHKLKSILDYANP